MQFRRGMACLVQTQIPKQKLLKQAQMIQQLFRNNPLYLSLELTITYV